MLKIPCKNSSRVKAIVVGDTHFMRETPLENEKIAAEIVRHVTDKRPDFVVLLGDIMHDHELIKVQPHTTVNSMLVKLSSLTHVILLIGNHDYINNSQFLTENHIFTPYKLWPNVTVVDKVVPFNVGELSFIACPYVEPGRFKEALDTVETEYDDVVWELSNCIFAHQEFKGCKMGSIRSVEGDSWSNELPQVISGHIHEAEELECGVSYPGSSSYTSYGCTTRRHLWYVEFKNDYTGSTAKQYSYTKLAMRLTAKKTVKVMAGDKVDMDKLFKRKNTEYKLVVEGTPEELNLFKAADQYTELSESVKISFKPTVAQQDTTEQYGTADTPFDDILRNVVADKESAHISSALDELMESV